MKKLIFSLLPLDQNPELLNPSVKFPWDLQEFLHQGRNVNHSWICFGLIMPFPSWTAEIWRTNTISTKWSPSSRSSLSRFFVRRVVHRSGYAYPLNWVLTRTFKRIHWGGMDAMWQPFSSSIGRNHCVRCTNAFCPRSMKSLWGVGIVVRLACL